MNSLSRRTAGLLLMAGLLQHSLRASAMTGALKWSARPWLRQLQEASSALATGAMSGATWQGEIERVLGRVELSDFLKSIDFETLSRAARFPDQGEAMERLYFLGEDERLQPLAFRPYLFSLKKGTAVVPHGHHNMATLHLVLQGSARVRHYDRLSSTGTHMLIRPASDEAVQPGHVSSISDDHHNIHWFEPLSDRVLMFNAGVYPIRQSEPFGERDYIDPAAGVAIGDGATRVPRLERAAAYAKYGRV